MQMKIGNHKILFCGVNYWLFLDQEWIPALCQQNRPSWNKKNCDNFKVITTFCLIENFSSIVLMMVTANAK